MISYGPFEVFRAGTFNPLEGQTATITENELRRIAASYDPESSPAPLVIGHPEIDAPAYGWVDKLYVQSGKLMATAKDVVAQFADMVKEGRYRKVSISLFNPGSSANPKPGDFYLKHIGFLGAAAPAVPGLKPVQFSNDDESLSFSQIAPHVVSFTARERNELSELRRQATRLRIDKLVEEGRILPVLAEEVISFASSLDATETVSFSDGETSTSRDWFFSYLSRQPKVVSFGRYAMGEAPANNNRQISVPEGFQVDESQTELFHRARKIEREKGVSFADAVARASEE